jgi:hypothetical protein
VIARILALFLPSWRLFDRVDVPTVLEVRKHGDSEWKDALPPQRRSWQTLFFNAEGNLHHACQSLIDRLAQELGSATPDALPEMDEYQRVRALAWVSSEGQLAQFRIRQGPHELLRSEEFV